MLVKSQNTNELLFRPPTIDVEVSCEICCTGCIFGHASVRPHELCSGRFNGQGADFFTDLTNRDFIIALYFRFIEQPID